MRSGWDGNLAYCSSSIESLLMWLVQEKQRLKPTCSLFIKISRRSFQKNLNYYLCDGRKHENIPQTVKFKAGSLLWNVNGHPPFLSLYLFFFKGNLSDSAKPSKILIKVDRNPSTFKKSNGNFIRDTGATSSGALSCKRG